MTRWFTRDSAPPEIAARFTRLTRLQVPCEAPPGIRFMWELCVDGEAVVFTTEEIVAGPHHLKFAIKTFESAGWCPPLIAAEDWRELLNELNARKRARFQPEDDD